MPQPPTGPSLSGSRARSAFVTERGPGLNRLAVMQPIDLGSGEDPILDLDRCGALSRLGQIVQRDHCIAQRLVINQYCRLSASLAGLRRHRFYLYRRSCVVPDCHGRDSDFPSVVDLVKCLI